MDSGGAGRIDLIGHCNDASRLFSHPVLVERNPRNRGAGNHARFLPLLHAYDPEGGDAGHRGSWVVVCAEPPTASSMGALDRTTRAGRLLDGCHPDHAEAAGGRVAICIRATFYDHRTLARDRNAGLE